MSDKSYAGKAPGIAKSHNELVKAIEDAEHKPVAIGGVMRSTYEDPELRARLERSGVKPEWNIMGFNVTYRELDNVCRLARSEGWSGLIGLDEAVGALIDD